MARPVGAENKDKPFREALRMELAAMGDDLKGLRKIAKSLICQAEEGEISAIKEIADRLDGKPAQATTISGDADNPLEVNVHLSPADRAKALAAFVAKSQKS